MSVNQPKNPLLPLQLPVVKVPLNPSKDITPEAMSAATTWLKEVTPKGTATFAGFSKKGEKSAVISGSCHAGMERMSSTFSHLFATSSYRGDEKKEIVAPFIEWLVYHSPYSDFILNKFGFLFIL